MPSNHLKESPGTESLSSLDSDDARWFDAHIKAQHWAHREPGGGQKNRDDNSFLVNAKLTPELYRRFYDFLKSKNWSKSRGVQYAIYKLLK